MWRVGAGLSAELVMASTASMQKALQLARVGTTKPLWPFAPKPFPCPGGNHTRMNRWGCNGTSDEAEGSGGSAEQRY